MSIPEFDVALAVAKLQSTPAIAAIPARRQGKKSKKSTNSSPLLPTAPNRIGTGLEWVTKPTDPDAPDYGARWAAFDLADLGRPYSVRVVRAGERVLAIYPPSLEPELVAYASGLLAEARPYLTAYMDRLPILSPAEAAQKITDIMGEHPGLRFCRGEDGSRWPLYPTTWTAGQKATVQSLWLVAGDALDKDAFMAMET